jgi:RNA 3'-terminal phosphate cyclase (ATP)
MLTPMITIDGSIGEGGGQALRTSLALSLVTGTPFRIENVRARRPRPGLMRQHLTAVHAAAAIGRATLRGAEIGSRTLEFVPETLVGGEHRFSIGTAGSATLVLQTILPALLRATTRSTVIVEGGTHNPLAPPFEFFARVYLPLLRRMGASVTATLERYGFYPSGGGCVRVDVEPCAGLSAIELVERGAVRARRAVALLSALPFDIARRELDTVRIELELGDDELRPQVVKDAAGPGNVVEIEIECDGITELFAAFGERGLRAEVVAQRACTEVREYLAAEVPVGRHLADQLPLPFALAGGGAFVSLSASPHLDTQCAILGRFLRCEVARTPLSATAWRYDVRVA